MGQASLKKNLDTIALTNLRAKSFILNNVLIVEIYFNFAGNFSPPRLRRLLAVRINAVQCSVSKPLNVEGKLCDRCFKNIKGKSQQICCCNA